MRRTAGGLAALATALVLLAPGTSQAANPLRLTKPVNVTKDDISPGRTYSAPFLLPDPANPKVILGGYAEMRNKTCGLIRSTDGGTSWKVLDSSPQLKSYPYCLENNSNIFQAHLAWGGNHTLYLASAGWDNQDSRSRVSVVLARSTDLGDSWTPTIVHDVRPTTGDTQESDRPITGLVVDAKSGSDDTIYVAYRRGYPNKSAPNAAYTQPTVAVSGDGGRTFGAPVSAMDAVFDDPSIRTGSVQGTTTLPGVTTTIAPAGSLAATPTQVANFGASGNGQGFTIDSKGTLYLAWMSGTVNVTPNPPSALILSKSTDHGKTWSASVVRPPSYENRQNPRMVWSPRGGSEGTLHLVYEGSDRPEVAAYAEVKYMRSTDGGRTWTPPQRLADDDPATLAGKFLPNVVVAPNGRVDVAWWDTRDDPGIRANDVYYTYSTDDGKTWARNVRVTDQSIDRRFGVWGNNFDQNSPPSLAATNQLSLFAWDDTRLSRGIGGPLLANNPIPDQGIGSGVQDIFFAVAQHAAVGGGASRAAKLTLAGAIGLLAVGLILVLVALASRRYRGVEASPAESVGGTMPDRVP
jgi:hypothetical protein